MDELRLDDVLDMVETGKPSKTKLKKLGITEASIARIKVIIETTKNISKDICIGTFVTK